MCSVPCRPVVSAEAIYSIYFFGNYPVRKKLLYLAGGKYYNIADELIYKCGCKWAG